MVYFVVTVNYDEAKDIESYTRYIEKVKPIVEKYHGRYMARSEKIKALNKEWSPDRVIIIEFDAREQLDKCFSSDEYRKIAFMREDSVDSKAIIIE